MTEGIIKVTTDLLVKTLEAVLKTQDLVPCVFGPAGVGKSSITQQIADAHFGGSLLDIRLGQLQEEDLIGIPSIVDGRTTYNLPFFWPTEGSGVIFFDEVNRATKGMMQCLFQLVLDRRYFNYVLPEGYRMVFAGNWGEANYFVQELDPALRSRFVIIYYTGPVYEEWKRWAAKNGITQEILSFLGIHQNMLVTEPKDDKPSPNPRTWKMASSILMATDDKDVRKVALSGVIGLEAAVMLLNYIEKEYEALPDPANLRRARDILRRWLAGKQNDRITAFLSSVVDYVEQGGAYELKEFKSFARMLPREFTFALYKGLFEREGSRRFVEECVDGDSEIFEILETAA